MDKETFWFPTENLGDLYSPSFTKVYQGKTNVSYANLFLCTSQNLYDNVSELAIECAVYTFLLFFQSYAEVCSL